jgi:acyl-CoA synthetase (AMP-forming)/AMP-acid ligase II
MECLNDMLRRNVRFIGDRPYLIGEDITLTYAQLNDLAGRLANVLAGHGVRKGDPVGLYLADNVMMATAFWACQRLGAVPTPMSAMYREKELRHLIGMTGMRLVLADAAVAGNITGDGTLAQVTVLVSSPGAGGSLQQHMAAAPAAFEDAVCRPDDVACLFFTSGTTGHPKGTIHTHLAQYAALRDMMVGHRSRWASETYLCATSLFTNLGATINVNMAMYSGGSVVLHDRWDTRKALDSIRRHRVTVFTGMPTMFIYLANAYDAAVDDLSSLRVCLIGGAPVPAAVVRRFEALCGARVLQVYGATEGVGQIVMEPLAGIRKPGSSGLPNGSCRITVVDAQRQPVPAGAVGEIRIAGDTVASGYWGDANSTAASFTAGGWLSGDAGYIDEDGYLFVVDRIKDVIICGGHNIFPLEVEEVLYEHPSVAVCAVVGVADDIKGEVPVAVIVRRDGATVSAAQIIEHCRSRVSAYKSPRHVYFIDTMPLNGGKVQKRVLARDIAEGRLRAS